MIRCFFLLSSQNIADQWPKIKPKTLKLFLFLSKTIEIKKKKIALSQDLEESIENVFNYVTVDNLTNDQHLLKILRWIEKEFVNVISQFWCLGIFSFKDFVKCPVVCKRRRKKEHFIKRLFVLKG